ncbi:MAG: hypothetical protein IPO83_03320 [Chitinophagaceae bacterium]|nr:hypothetical protein [Chitinophagaceae bacterium]
MIKNYSLRAACFSLLLVLFSAVSFAQTNGIFESYAILSLNGGANAFYDMNATTGNPDFQGASLGSYTTAQSIVVKGGQNKTFKCDGGDITNGHLKWRVWLTSSGAGGSFNTENMSFVSNDAGGCGGNQTWEGTGGTTNIISSLTVAGNYTLEVFSDADGIPGTTFLIMAERIIKRLLISVDHYQVHCLLVIMLFPDVLLP